MKRSDVFMKVGVAVAMLYLISGFVFGGTIDKYGFSITAALIIWLLGASSVLACYAIYGHFDNQEKMLEYEKSTHEKLSRLVTHFVGEEVEKPHSPSQKLNLSNIVSEDKNGSWICSNCQTKNSSSELTCKDCGAKK